MGVVLELGLHLCYACYEMEGDGPMIVYAYDILMKVYDIIQQPSFTELNHIFGRVSGNDPDHAGIPIFLQQFGVKKASVYTPVQSYIEQLYFSGILGQQDFVTNGYLKKLKLLRVFNPAWVMMNINTVDDDYVKQLDFLPLTTIDVTVLA
eukprot:Awhi_evm1s10317